MKKGRPESRQKKSDHTDGKMSTDLKKKNETSEKPTTKLTDGLKTVDSATSMIKGEVDREKSFLSLDRKKSATGRISTCRIGGVRGDKSALSLQRQKSSMGRKLSSTRLSNNSRNVRKFAGRKKRDKSGVDDDDDFDEKSGGAKLFEGKIWDKEIEKLALRKKRVSAMEREIGLNHVKILPPTPTIQTVGVRKKRVEKKAKIATVMKPAGSDAEIVHHLYKDKGPRYDQLGHIIPHSILGDVESFLSQSQQADKVGNILLVHTPPQSQAVRGSKSVENNTSLYNLCVNQKNALNTWENEMEIRCKEKNRLAGLLKCDETELLMCRSGKRADKEAANILQRGDWRCHPDVCFWKLAQTITAGQLHETLSKSDRGVLPTPVLSGDADTILQEKSKVHKADLCTRFSGDSVTKKIESVKGKIQITNKVLFDKLFLQGEPVKSSEEAIGDNLAQSRGARLFMENRIDVSGGCTDESEEGKIGAFFSKFFGTRRMSKSVRETREMMKFKGISPEVDDEVCRGHESQSYDRSKRRKSTYGDVVMSEQISRMNKNRPVMDFRFVGLEKEEIDGPALLVDGTTLRWSDFRDYNDNGCHRNSVVKEVIVVIKGEAGSLMRAYAKLENVGSTVIRYFWMKVAESKSLPVPRPHRRFFYFLDDEGVVLPRETVYVPMLFRSTIAGYFAESWLLCTQPQLEGGAKVKFKFKAITRCESDYSKQIQEIKDYMKMKEAQNICLPQVQSIIDYAILKAEVTTAYQPVEESMEVIFMKRNPGLYYYGHIIRRLQLLCETYIALNDLEKLENGDIIVSVLDLWQAFLALPDDDDNDDDNDNAADDNDDHDDDNDDHDDDDNVSDDSKNESYINLTRKQTLLWHLYKDFYTMSFQPVLMLETSFHSKYIKMYTLLQIGIDKIVSYAQDLADSLGLAPKKEIIGNEQAVEKKEKGKSKSKGRATSKASKVGKKGLTPDHVSPSPTAQKAVPKDVIEFSAAHKFRAENTEQFNPMLAKYDEKVYLEVYRMLSSTIEEMSVLFENK